jgi:serine/threonine protein kinase
MRRVIFDVDRCQRKDLGCGAFGVVYSGHLSSPDVDVAIKEMYPAKMTSEYEKAFMREIELMAHASHPCVVSLVAWDFGNPWQLVTVRYATNLGDRHMRHATPTQKSCIALGIAAGMRYLHSINVIHRDLKPENVLLDDCWRPHVADFGLAKQMTQDAKSNMTGGVGTPRYMAPELQLADANYSFPVDVYAFALLLWELSAGEAPFKGQTSDFALGNAVQRGIRPQPEKLPEKWREMVVRGWEHDPRNRPTFREWLADPDWFRLDRCNLDEFQAYRKEIGV